MVNGIEGNTSPRQIERLTTQGRSKIKIVRGVQKSDLSHIVSWGLNSTTEELEAYYQNAGKPDEITPLVAVNPYDELVGILTMRWKGSSLVPKDRKIAFIEGLTANPQLEGISIRQQMTLAVLEVAFKKYKGYKGRESAGEVRILAEEIFPDFIQDLEFEMVKGKKRDTAVYRLTKKRWEMMRQERPELVSLPVDLVSLRL